MLRSWRKRWGSYVLVVAIALAFLLVDQRNAESVCNASRSQHDSIVRIIEAFEKDAPDVTARARDALGPRPDCSTSFLG